MYTLGSIVKNRLKMDLFKFKDKYGKNLKGQNAMGNCLSKQWIPRSDWSESTPFATYPTILHPSL